MISAVLLAVRMEDNNPAKNARNDFIAMIKYHRTFFLSLRIEWQRSNRMATNKRLINFKNRPINKVIHPCWISIFFIFISIVGLRKIRFLTFSVSNRSFGKGLCFVYAIIIAVGSSEDIADFNCLLRRKRRKNHLPLSRRSTKFVFTKERRKQKRNRVLHTHTHSHLNANISLIISQTKKCFGLKNCLDLSFCFVSFLLN